MAADMEKAWALARGLLCRIEEGGHLPVIELEFMGAADEALHADQIMDGWWWGPANVAYEHRELLDFGSPLALAFTAAATVIGNRRRRETARFLASPQWRPFGCGPVRVLVTSRRVVVWDGSDALSLWFDERLRLIPELDEHRLVLLAATGPPVALQGTWVPYLAVAVVYLLTGEPVVLDASGAPSGSSVGAGIVSRSGPHA